MRTVYWVGLQHVDCSLLLSWQSDFMRLLHSYCLSATDLVLFSFLEMSPEPAGPVLLGLHNSFSFVKGTRWKSDLKFILYCMYANLNCMTNQTETPYFPSSPQSLVACGSGLASKDVVPHK